MSAGRGAPGPHLDDDAIALLAMTAFFGGPLIAMLAGAGAGIANWLTEHGILTRQAVVIELAAGAGLDIARLAIATGILLALVAWAVHIVKRRRAGDRNGGRGR